jgi:hypothetical protein
MTTCTALTEFVQTHKSFIAILISVVGGIPVTFVWTESWHRYLAWTETAQPQVTEADQPRVRDRVIGISLVPHVVDSDNNL